MMFGRHNAIALHCAVAVLVAGGCSQLLGLDEDEQLVDSLVDDGSCSGADDCDDGNPCTADSCDENQRCRHRVLAIAVTDVAGDCRRSKCDAGQLSYVVDDLDTPAPTDCDIASCSDGEIVAGPVDSGTSCDSDEGQVCDGDGTCVGCMQDTDCSEPDTCGGDGIDHSCGCAPLSCFEMGRTCGQVSDTCFATLDCNDGNNGDETDVDCGGDPSGCSTRCSLGQQCLRGSDCHSGLCGGGVCANPWDRGFGSPGNQRAGAVAAGPDGSSVVVGNFTDEIDFGGGALANSGADEAMFVAKLDAMGQHQFSQSYEVGTPRDVVVDSSGNIIVVGGFVGSLDFGGGVMTSGQLERPFIVKLDSNGQLLWQQTFVGSSNSSASATAAAIGPSDEIIIVGEFSSDLTVGGVSLLDNGAGDIFITKLSTSGTVAFALSFGDAQPDRANDVAAASDGTIALVGDFAGSIDFGSGAHDSLGGWDIYLARIDGSGNLMQAMTFGSESSQTVGGVAFDGQDVVIAGSFTNAIEVDETMLVSNGLNDAFVAKLDDGFKSKWVEAFGDASDQHAIAIATDSQGGTVVGGSFAGNMSFGAATLSSLGGFDVFVAKLDSNGGVLFSQAFGDSHADNFRDVDVTPFGTVLLTGDFRGSIDFGQGSITSHGADDVFVAALSP